jgi:hypothetical protein
MLQRIDGAESGADEGAQLRTLAPRSGWFFAAIVLGPVAVAVLGLSLLSAQFRSAWYWVIAGAGLLAIWQCLRRWRVRYFVFDDGMERRRIGGRDRLEWSEVQAVGTWEVREKFGGGIMVCVYGRRHVFRAPLRVEDARALVQRLRKNCQDTVWIDERTGRIEPTGRASEDVMRRHRKRLLRGHWMLAIAWLVTLVAVLGSHAMGIRQRGQMWGGDWGLIASCLGIYVMVSWEHWKAIRRLRQGALRPDGCG